MAEPQVSVVVIFLNEAAFLEEAIASVRAQTLGAWELLLVDDGSTDGSGEIAHAAAELDPDRVHVLVHEGGQNRGMSASRNLGIERARAPRIAFLDGDDVWLPTRLERHVALLDAHPEAALVCGPTRLWFSWVADHGDAAAPPRADGLRTLGVPRGPIDAPEVLVRVLDERAKTPAICSFTARTEVVRAVGGFDDDFPGLFEDQVFFAKMLLRHRVVLLDECLDLYRQHPGSACYAARLSGRYHGSVAHPEQRAFVERLGELVQAAGVASPALDRAIERWRERYRHPLRARVRDFVHDPRRSLRMGLRTAASCLLPERIYRRVWARAQGFDARHGEPPR